MNEIRNYVVYIHTNKADGKVYVGLTSQKPERRWGKDGCGYDGQYFGEAIKAIGWNNFDHSVVATGLTREEACQKEIELIREFDSTNPNCGYNVSLGGDSGNGQKVVCIETGEVFDSEGAAAAKYGVAAPNIWYAAFNNATSAGYHWKLVEDFNHMKPGRKYQEGVHVVCVETGKEFVSYREAADYYNISNAYAIRDALNNFEKAVGGKHWMSPLSTGIDDQQNEEENDEKFFEEAEEAELEDYFNDYLQYTCDEEWS